MAARLRQRRDGDEHSWTGDDILFNGLLERKGCAARVSHRREPSTEDLTGHEGLSEVADGHIVGEQTSQEALLARNSTQVNMAVHEAGADILAIQVDYHITSRELSTVAVAYRVDKAVGESDRLVGNDTAIGGINDVCVLENIAYLARQLPRPEDVFRDACFGCGSGCGGLLLLWRWLAVGFHHGQFSRGHTAAVGVNGNGLGRAWAVCLFLSMEDWGGERSNDGVLFGMSSQVRSVSRLVITVLPLCIPK